MPLEEGKAQETISRNISTLVREGKTRDEAIAIALEKAKTDQEAKYDKYKK